MMTEVIQELVNNDEETRDERGSEVTQPQTLLTTTISLESTNNAATEGNTLKYHKGKNFTTNFLSHQGMIRD
jgi:hypothetical protein